MKEHVLRRRKLLAVVSLEGVGVVGLDVILKFGLEWYLTRREAMSILSEVERESAGHLSRTAKE